MTARRAPSSVGPAEDVLAITEALLATSDGATVTPSGTPYRGDGIIVAMPEHGTTVTSPDYLFAEVLDWVMRVAPAVTAIGATPARYFGAWWDEGKLYLDVVQAFSSADRDLAIAAGRARNQIAIWDAARQCEIPTGGDGTTAAA